MKPQPNHRQQEILSLLQKSGGSARTQVIAQTLDVSEETVRRNIKHLATVGAVEKLHGGARIVGNAEETSFQQRLSENPDAKRHIAHKVAQMIPNGSSLFLDIGSTTAFISDALRDHQNLLVVTNSIAVAYKLATRNNNRVFMAGGELRSHDGGAFGMDAMNFADNFQTDFAVLSAAGINAANGFMLFDLEEAKFSRLIMSKSATRIIAADARKFNRVAPVTIGKPNLVDYLVCDAPPPKDIAQACESWTTEITLAT